MADNIIKGIIQIEANGVTTTANAVFTATSKMEQGFKKLSPASNQATTALTNVGRVAQDLPFGFISIANNLNPLLESFQRLKQESGSTGGALKALGSSLVGGGGLGLALSAITAAASFASIGFGAWTRGMNSTSKEAKKLADDLAAAAERITEITSKSVSDVTNGARGGVESEVTRVQILTQAVLDQTKSYQERNNALNQLKDINKNYFGDLTLEANSLKTLTTRLDEYTNAIIAAAVTKAFADEIGNASKELAIQLNLYNKLGKERDNAKRVLDATQRTKIVGSAGGGVEVVTAEYNKAQKAFGKANDALKEQGTVVSQVANKIAIFRQNLKDAITEELKFKPLQSVAPPKIKPDKVETIEPKQHITLVGDLDIKPKNLNILDTPNIRRPDTRFAFLTDEERKKIKQMRDELELTQYVGNTLANTLSDAFSGLVDSIAEGANVLKSFGQIVKRVIVDLIKAVVQAALFSVLAKAFGVISPSGGGILSELFTGRRAAGGPVSAGGTYLVGENGPEVLRMGVNGSILPNSRLGSYGGGSLGGQVQFVISGNNLVGVLSAAGRNQRRLV